MKTGITGVIFCAVVVCFITGLLGVEEAEAVVAAPVVRTLIQADGSAFTARLWGDERLHGWETEDGYSIAFNESLQNWTYAVTDGSGRLTASSWVVGKTRPTEVLQKHIRPAGDVLVEVLQRKAIQPPDLPQKVVPPSGAANIPVILINFNNTTTTYNTPDFDTLLFGTGNKSMKDYYEEVSYGAFSVSPGPAGVVGWYTTANNHDYYGTNNAQGQDTWPGDLVYEAVAAADATVDFSAYDSDGDCYVDVVGIVHQGTGEEVGEASTDIWSHRWNLSSARNSGYSNYGIYTTGDSDASCPGGYKVNDYIIMPELYRTGPPPIQSTIGVFAHEYGHALGLPDLYDTDGSSEGIGNWGLMSGGTWNYVTRQGDTPAHMSAWSKYRLGWVTPTQVTYRLTDESIDAAATAADVYQLLSGSPSTGGEYFLVENRQRVTGTFDEGLPAAGLAIWHIEESRTSNANECYPPSDCSATHYWVSLEQADGNLDLEKNNNRGDSGDLYPGSTNNTSFTGSSIPDSDLYNGTASYVKVTSISASAPTMTATFIAVPEPDISVTDSSGTDNDLEVPFGDIPNTSHTVTVTNLGDADLNISQIPYVSDQPGLFWPFSITDNCSNQTLAPSATCTLTILFTDPSPDTGSWGKVVRIPSDDPDESEVVVAMCGTSPGEPWPWTVYLTVPERVDAEAYEKVTGSCLPEEGNHTPARPAPVSPEDGETGLETTVTFQWEGVTDPEGDPVTYEIRYCEDNEGTPENCIAAKVEESTLTGSPGRTIYAGLGAGAGLLLFGMVVAGDGRRRKIVLLAGIIILTAMLLVSCGKGTVTDVDNSVSGETDTAILSYTVEGLNPDTTYSWQVVASDDKGAASLSYVRSFTTVN
ncbi:MAG: M6 family metalloprotease domain-containing protein [Nitrospirota bacterium]|nr:M6 family metalloprotease domain-containing protein [Nitrospirota bacterium]